MYLFEEECSARVLPGCFERAGARQELCPSLQPRPILRGRLPLPQAALIPLMNSLLGSDQGFPFGEKLHFET